MCGLTLSSPAISPPAFQCVKSVTLIIYLQEPSGHKIMIYHISDGGPLPVFFKLPVSEISEIDDHKSVRNRNNRTKAFSLFVYQSPDVIWTQYRYIYLFSVNQRYRWAYAMKWVLSTWKTEEVPRAGGYKLRKIWTHTYTCIFCQTMIMKRLSNE